MKVVNFFFNILRGWIGAESLTGRLESWSLIVLLYDIRAVVRFMTIPSRIGVTGGD